MKVVIIIITRNVFSYQNLNKLNGTDCKFDCFFLYFFFVFIPRHTLVARYYVIPFGVCPSVHPSVRPCSPFPIDNLSIYSRNFFKFCIHIVIGDEWYGIVNG